MKLLGRHKKPEFSFLHGRSDSCRILFVSWDGPQVNYLESVYLPLFDCLRHCGIAFHVLHLTWSLPESVVRLKAFSEERGIGYTHIRIHLGVGSLGQFLACLQGALYIRHAIQSRHFNCLMPRSVIPGLICLMSRQIGVVPVVFDADGLAFDEKVDFNSLLSTSLTYRFFRDIESHLVRLSHKVIVRTSKAAEILYARAGAGTLIGKFLIAANGRNPRIFRPLRDSERKDVRDRLGLSSDCFLLIYVGSVGSQYCLAEALEIFSRIRESHASARFLIVTFSCVEAANLVANCGGDMNYIKIISASAEEMPALIGAADAGFSLRSSTFSMQAVSPIKIGEYLLCGLPVIVSNIAAVSDLMNSSVIHTLEALSPEKFDQAASWLLKILNLDRQSVSDEARALGVEQFSLKKTADVFASAILDDT